MTEPASPGLSGAQEELLKEIAQLRDDNTHLTQALAGATDELQRLRFKVSHDLRAPLRHVGAFALVIKEDFGPQLDSEVLAHLATIQTAAAKMGQMLDDILTPEKPAI